MKKWRNLLAVIVSAITPLMAISVDCWAKKDYRLIHSIVDIKDLENNIKTLVGFGSRVSGYEGCDQAAEFIYRKFKEAGLDYVTYHQFYLPSPIDKGASLQVGSENYKVYALWPNLVCTSHLPPKGITGELIYAADGELFQFNGKEVKDSIVLLNFNCESNWMNAPLLGAKAVIFIEPEDTIRMEAEKKFLKVAVSFPRFWIPRAEGLKLVEKLRSLEKTTLVSHGVNSKKGSESPKVIGTLKCQMEWENKAVKNVIGLLEGADPELRKECLIIQAYYDSISVVPALSPGAEQSCGIAALLELLKVFKANPPARSVLFLATPGHFQALSGAKEFVHMLGKDEVLGPPGALERAVRWAFGKVGIKIGKKRGQRAERIEEKKKMIKELSQRVEKAKGELEKAEREKVRAEKSAGAARKLKRREKEIEIRLSNLRELKMRLKIAKHDLKILRRLYKYRFPLFISIDLSSRNDVFGVFQVGWFYRQDYLMRFFSPIGKRLMEYIVATYGGRKMPGEISRALRTQPEELQKRFVDGINPTKDRDWRTYFPGKTAFDCEMATRAGRPGIVFATIDDNRPLVDTPLDQIDKVNFKNLCSQTQLLACLTSALTDDSELVTETLKRLRKLRDELKEVRGKVLEFRRTETFLPSTPVPGSIVLVQGLQKASMGVHPDVYVMADDEARFTLVGHMDYEAKLEAYHLNKVTGEIDYAPDLGQQGEVKYPRGVRGRGEREGPIIVFPCVSLSVLDLVDEQYLQTLEQVFLYDAVTNSEPLSFGYSLPQFAAAAAQGEVPSYTEPCCALFVPPKMRVKATLAMGLLGLRMVLINATNKEPEGIGFLPEKTKIIRFAPYQAAQDMYILDHHRLTNLEKHGVFNLRLSELHNVTKFYLKEARKAKRDKRYDQFLALSRHAWGCESRAYPDVEGTANDVVKGVLFYLAMLLPFAYFMERLLFAFPDIKRRIIYTFGIFILMFLIIRLVHPAFEITTAPIIVLLAFIILALSLIVISIVTAKFNELLKMLKEELTGVHEADVNRLSAAASAFSLGLSNMRRRKARTILTCITLIFLTFIVLSFTSVKSFLRSNQINLRRKPPYIGLMLRDKIWDPLEGPTYRIIANEFSSGAQVAPRAWLSSSDPQRRALYDIRCRQRTSEFYTINGIVGLSEREPKVTKIAKSLVKGGRWFSEKDVYACILPESVAKKLKIKPADMGKVDIQLFSMNFRVIGICKDKLLEKLKDLDGEPLTPVDYSALKPEIIEEMKRQAQRTVKFKATALTAFLQEYTHFLPENVIILPFQTTLNLGGTLRSVAVKFRRSEDAQAAVDKLMKRFALNIYAGYAGETYLYSSVGWTTFSGVEVVAIPILLAALIVLNTMLGSVFERVKEIETFSSVGLAPVHVGSLFLAESCVYATIGAVAGYLMGQVTAWLLFLVSKMPALTAKMPILKELAGLSLNYSSQSAVGVTVIVIAVVLLSTLYPAKRAAELATPAIERKWKIPEPEGDEMRMRLPFTLSGGDPEPCGMFLKEFFDAHIDYTGGDFCIDKAEFSRISSQYGSGFSLKSRMWLAPYDLGVSQLLEILIVPTEERHIFEIIIKMHREAGDIASWKKTNWFFLNDLRKQFLIWRTIRPAQKKKYLEEAERILAPVPAGTTV